MIFNKKVHFFKIVGLHWLFFVYNICWTDRYLKRNLCFDFRKDTVLKQQDFNQKIEELVGIGQNKDGQLTTDEIKKFLQKTVSLQNRRQRYSQKFRKIILL